MDEATTRKTRIDRQLARAGWTAESRLVLGEFLLQGGGLIAANPHESYTLGPDEFVDYALMDRLGRPVAMHANAA